MKIDSVITMEVKTREEELEDKWWEELDNAINKYVKYAIEYDRITRKI